MMKFLVVAVFTLMGISNGMMDIKPLLDEVTDPPVPAPAPGRILLKSEPMYPPPVFSNTDERKLAHTKQDGQQPRRMLIYQDGSNNVPPSPRPTIPPFAPFANPYGRRLGASSEPKPRKLLVQNGSTNVPPTQPPPPTPNPTMPPNFYYPNVRRLTKSTPVVICITDETAVGKDSDWHCVAREGDRRRRLMRIQLNLDETTGIAADPGGGLWDCTVKGKEEVRILRRILGRSDFGDYQDPEDGRPSSGRILMDTTVPGGCGGGGCIPEPKPRGLADYQDPEDGRNLVKRKVIRERHLRKVKKPPGTQRD